jgi:hypothetical protein
MDETPKELRARIAHLQQLADGVTDRQVKDAIEDMIAELEQRLRELESKSGLQISSFRPMGRPGRISRYPR